MAFTHYLFAYPHFESMLAPIVSNLVFFPETIDDQALGKSMLWAGVLCLLALIPLMRRAPVRTLLATRWSILRAVFGGFGIAWAFLVVAAFLKGLMLWSGLAIGAGSDTVRSMRGIEQALGPWALIGFAALLIPVMEEFLFRGVLLRAGARHLAVWAAVAIQSAVFAVWHEDPLDYPAMFVFGIATAWLAIRSGGLLAPIACHATVNLLAAVQIMHAGRLAGQGG
jgi:membrane protease YdiL (CAAX protease family)